MIFSGSCATCRQFDNDPESLEREFPGWTILGSAYGSARGSAGICRLREIFLDAEYGCKLYEARSKFD
jgi:hypothetical protein